ncbi:MAG: hypothetical protein JSR98_09020 [Proteobacteria bacterium]|nr:hypothetical protein [Pseudomonadota bacterium]
MRFVLVLLAVMGLIASPAAAAAAQAACHDRGGQAMMDMPMAGMPGMAQADGQKTDPCCDPGKDQGQTKHDATSCLQACAVMCGIVAALPAVVATPLAPPARVAPKPAPVASLKPHEPSRLERPPRSIA